MDPRVEEELSIMAAERGCDRELDWRGCEDCVQYEVCLAKCQDIVRRMKPPSSEE